MTPEQLEKVWGYAVETHVPLQYTHSKRDKDEDDEWHDAVHAIENAFIAMRQPITAEALTAEGWSKVGWIFTLGGDGWFSMRYDIDDKRWEFAIGRPGRAIIASPTNMYDLGELVRLLGGHA